MKISFFLLCAVVVKGAVVEGSQDTCVSYINIIRHGEKPMEAQTCDKCKTKDTGILTSGTTCDVPKACKLSNIGFGRQAYLGKCMSSGKSLAFPLGPPTMVLASKSREGHSMRPAEVVKDVAANLKLSAPDNPCVHNVDGKVAGETASVPNTGVNCEFGRNDQKQWADYVQSDSFSKCGKTMLVAWAHLPLPGLMEYLKVPNYKTNNASFVWPAKCPVPAYKDFPTQPWTAATMDNYNLVPSTLPSSWPYNGNTTSESICYDAIYQIKLTKASEKDAKWTVHPYVQLAQGYSGQGSGSACGNDLKNTGNGKKIGNDEALGIIIGVIVALGGIFVLLSMYGGGGGGAAGDGGGGNQPVSYGNTDAALGASASIPASHPKPVKFGSQVDVPSINFFV